MRGEAMLSYEPRTSRLISTRQFVNRLVEHGVYVVVLVVISLLAGMIGYVWLGGLSWVDAFMNASMLLGGMGPVNELRSDAAKIFAGVYALYSGLVFIASAGILVAPVAHRILHRLHIDDENAARQTRRQ